MVGKLWTFSEAWIYNPQGGVQWKRRKERTPGKKDVASRINPNFIAQVTP